MKPSSNIVNNRITAKELRRVRHNHILEALDILRNGNNSDYGRSRKFDVLTDKNELFPPKELFGIAATIALGYQVKPEHFSGGSDSICQEILEENGFKIIPKEDYPEIKWWYEGTSKLVTHKIKERDNDLRRQKKSEFIKIHGKLFCEKCGMDPEENYGPEGNACIEVHHKDTHVSDMQQNHRTRLEHLEVLCANCHRVEHRRLKLLE